MKKQTTPLIALVAGLMLAACEQAPPPAPTQSAVDISPAAASPLDRKLDPQQVARGLIVYEHHCASCHGAEGKGQPGDWRIRDAKGMYPPPPLDDSAHAWHHPTAVLLEAIRDGSPKGEGNMPGWKGKLTEQDMQDVAVYIKSLWSDQVYLMWLDIERRSLVP
ncbi:MAG: c-type cytochrome [Thiobacillus sp.]